MEFEKSKNFIDDSLRDDEIYLQAKQNFKAVIDELNRNHNNSPVISCRSSNVRKNVESTMDLTIDEYYLQKSVQFVIDKKSLKKSEKKHFLKSFCRKIFR